MPLLDDIALLDNNRIAANLVKNSQELRAQQTTVQSDIATKRPLVKADIQADIWVLADIEEIVQLTRLNQSINARHTSNKTALIAIKPLLTDAGYQAEVQAEIDLLP